jgi:integrase
LDVRSGRTPDLNRLVFPSDHGGCHSKGYDGGWADRRYRKQRGGPVLTFAGWRTEAKVRNEVTFHCLRHTCASMLMMGGYGFKLELYEVSRWLGHSDIKVTQRYAHLDPEFLHERVERIFELGVATHSKPRRE